MLWRSAVSDSVSSAHPPILQKTGAPQRRQREREKGQRQRENEKDIEQAGSDMINEIVWKVEGREQFWWRGKTMGYRKKECTRMRRNRKCGGGGGRRERRDRDLALVSGCL